MEDLLQLVSTNMLPLARYTNDLKFCDNLETISVKLQRLGLFISFLRVACWSLAHSFEHVEDSHHYLRWKSQSIKNHRLGYRSPLPEMEITKHKNP